MKILKSILFILVICIATQANAQLLKKISKRAKKAVERTVERRVENETSKKTDQALDSIFEGNKNKNNKKNKGKNESQSKDVSVIQIPGTEKESSKELEVYSKFDFVPGDKILLYDDFSLDNMGDFPAKWNTNGTGELVIIEGQRWMQLAGKSIYIPDVLKPLPENYTIEFDMLTKGLDKKTSSQAKLEVWLEDHNQFNTSKNKATIEIPLWLLGNTGFIVENKVKGARVIRNKIEKDIRDIISEKIHVSIAVNGKRFRMWMNENKVVDIPRLIPENIVSFKLHPRDIRDGIDHVYVRDFKIAASGIDLRSQLLNEGRFSTTGILFNSGSDQIKPESNGVLKQIADALQQDTSLNLNIIGHTDADGNEGNNLKLSQQRAISVKNILVSQFYIANNRLQTEGKGETEPVDENTTTEGKANNRRVEFVKI
ncbi:OmpA family protein [Mariniflexile sp.]|uniref:OmpA family protein n=1 Tax=Mariniflexile sp. TaxID=1979402 RepID=UPI004047E278